VLPNTESSAGAAARGALEPGVAFNRAPCERCQSVARVTILEGYENNQPVRRRLCMACADEAFDRGAGRRGLWQGKLSFRAVLLLAGGVLALLGALADVFGHHGAAGFGCYQLAAVSVGGLFVVIGALLRIDLLVLPGAILFALGVLADAFGRVGTPGLGWRQQTLIVLGAVLLLLGAVRWRGRPGTPVNRADPVDPAAR
jgi:hypothetical protein